LSIFNPGFVIERSSDTLKNTAYIFFLIVIFWSFAETVHGQAFDSGINYITTNSANIKAAHNAYFRSEATASKPENLDAVMSESVLRSIESLSADFLNFSSDDLEKVKEIFLWVAKNIDYDISAATNSASSNLNNNAISVFYNGKGLCLGFAELFATLCRHSGIDARVIVGYAKGANYDDNAKFAAPNHAWNSVKVNGKWRLMDVAWASSLRLSIEEQFDNLPDNEFTDRYLLDYFMVSPTEFIKTHLPEDPFWQLIGEPVKLSTFEAGEAAIIGYINNAPGAHINFEHLIAGHEDLDSLDRTICYYERMIENNCNQDREFALGLAYFYKAQMVMDQLPNLESTEKQLAAKRAGVYYGKALQLLEIVEPSSPYFDNGSLICNNIRLKVESLGGSVYF
jgi:hypothetical protein